MATNKGGGSTGTAATATHNTSASRPTVERRSRPAPCIISQRGTKFCPSGSMSAWRENSTRYLRMSAVSSNLKVAAADRR